MLREELLRSKNDEIARCLLSRKRKLSELYFATVGLTGATEGTPSDSLYQQKEQAFLDANDLSKGRYFNEATLPSLPNYATLLSHLQGKETVPAAAESESNAREVADIAPQSRVEAGVSPQPVAAGIDQHGPKVQRQTTGQPPSVVPATEPSARGFAPETSKVPHEPTPVTVQPVPSPKSEKKVKTEVLETPLSSQDQDSAELNNVSPGRAGAGPAPVGTAPAALTEKKQNKLPSLDVGPPSHAADQPLSPVSSVEPYSNTPAPVTASPDTSPAEEATDAVEKIDQTRFKHDRSREAHPGLVPSTPDEQLRLEEAQSLAAGKSIGDDLQNGGYPSTNEVIQESVTAPSTSRIGVAKESTLSPLSSEVNKPGEITVTSTESLTRTQHPAEPVQSPVDAGTKKTAPVATALKKSQQAPAPQPVAPQPERMMTRVSSGAIRHKSVSEILGETPKPAEKATTPTRATSEKREPVSTARMRLKDRKEREKERSKLSTVVFPRQQPEKNESMDLIRQNAGDMVTKVNEEQDYLFTLFQNKAYSPPRGINLSTLLASAHKTLTTANHFLDYQEQMDCRTLRRVYALQNANRWPLRQLKRSVEPPRQASHWDVLLDHMKWMRTDFREERKWKIAAAKCCADWCAEYVNTEPEHRALLRIQARVPTLKAKETDTPKIHMVSPPEEMDDEMLGVSHPTPDLLPSTEEDSVIDGFNDEPRHDLHDTVAPAAIFSLGSDEFTFSMDMTPAADKLLGELPVYTPVKIAPDTNMPTFKSPPDSAWKTELLPVSKYATGHIKYHEEEPVRKRSRYDYSQYDSEPEHPKMELPPEQTNVALFRPENKPIRDRIHPGHSFRPPTEHPMPSVGFFESRQSSQWTYAEDDELRRLVKEYSYNWSLISSCVTPPSQFTSGAERRTPWECFERWIGLEGLPADMSKTQYFRAYHQRLETAQRNVLAQQQAAQQQQQQQQQQQGNNPQSQLLVRRRTTQPLRVDRRRSSKHLALLDAMRKLAKKRETILQKQQHASHLASLRKVNEANHPKPPISSPAEFSRLKYDRELKLQERQEQYRQQMLAQQRANLAAQRAGQLPNQQPMLNVPGRHPNGMPHNPAGPGMPGSTPNGLPNGLPPGVGVNQGRPHAMQGIPGATPVNGPIPHNAMAMKMMPQSGMQQANNARPGIPMQAVPDNARVIREASRLQEQQRILQSRQQQQGQQQQQPQQTQQQFHNQQQFGPQGSHSPNMNMSNVNGTHNNPAMIAALQAAGGMQSPPFHNGNPQGVSTPSPRMGQPNPLSSGVVPTISNIQSQIQRSNPNMSPEQVNKLATERLHQYQQQRMSQVAMNAAAGNLSAVQANYQVSHDANFQAHSQPGMPNGAPGMQVQGYSPMMRVSQNAQQNRASVANSPPMNGAVPQPSRSATPQTQRSGSVQAGAGPGSSKSPRPPQAQMASS